MTPDDLRAVLRDLPVAALVLVGLWAAMVLIIAAVPA